jgi:hypothetical protein
MTALKKEAWPGDKPTGKVRRFEVTIQKTVVVSIDESVLEQARTEPTFFRPPLTDGGVAEHVAFNLVCNSLRLSQIDGYANCPDESAVVSRDEDWDVRVEREVPALPPKREVPALPPGRVRRRRR